jgi:signal transduction histidine kinase
MMSSESIKVNVFENLFSNSIKALEHAKHKLISIDTLIDNDKVKIVFSDTGRGIPEQVRSRVFSLWETATGGTGIGLATVKDTVLDHEGKIDYIKEGYESFSTSFMVEFPIYK